MALPSDQIYRLQCLEILRHGWHAEAERLRRCLLGGDAADEGLVVVYDEYGPVRMIRSAKDKYVCR